MTASQIREGDPLKIIIVVANYHSGLFSCGNWLRYGRHGLDTWSVNLSDVQDAGNEPDERLRVLLQRFKSQAKGFTESSEANRTEGDPIEFIRRLREWEARPEVILLRNFDSLDAYTAERLFGRLRALYEDSVQAKDLPSLVLLGHSTAPLDPEEKGPVSSLLKLAECYTLSGLQEPEVQKMAEKSALKANEKKLNIGKGEIRNIMTWTGGHPLLVQAIFSALANRSGDQICR
ncbi:MAG TPA: AAA-like domain-containing protein [Thermoanaerobaculia bacterium]|nr:AAA-like domain-containing protein [Thermoanaerobaculia bacterium]